jgi:hypothetical protein
MNENSVCDEEQLIFTACAAQLDVGPIFPI